MSDQSEILKILNEQSRDLGYIKGKVESIEEQAKKTNGRVTALETAETEDKIRWAKLGIVLTGMQVVITTAFYFGKEYIKQKVLHLR